MPFTARGKRQPYGTRAALVTAVAVAALSVHCGSAPSGDPSIGSDGASEALSTTIHSVYGITTFGGPGDYQALACGGNSRNVNKWYVASSQRYGCDKHLKLTANGKCVVVRTADAGPATYVETRAGVPVLDSSPAVAQYFFGVSGLGYADLKSHPGMYNVHAAVTDDDVGPCGSSTPPDPGSSSSGGSSSGDPGSSSSGGSSSGDPGSSSSGGSSSGGSSSGGSSSGGSSSGGSSSGGSSSGGSSSGGSSSGGSSSGGSSSGGSSSGGSSSGGGSSCSSDGDCNPGNDGSGLICVGGECVPGCHHDYQCPGVQTCVSGNCE